MIDSQTPKRLARRRMVGRRPAFTLVEVLLALTLTALLVTLTGRIAVQLMASSRTVRGSVAQLERSAALKMQLQEDLGALLSGLPDSHRPVSLAGTPQRLEFNLLAPVESNQASLHVARRPASVCYRLQTNRNTGGTELIRESRDLTDRAAALRAELVAEDLESFHVELRCKERWVTHYPEASSKAMPTLARITLGRRGAPLTESFLVPIHHAH